MSSENLQSVIDAAKKGAGENGLGNSTGSAAAAAAGLKIFESGKLKDIVAPDFNTPAAAAKGAAGAMNEAAEKITTAMPSLAAKLSGVTESLSSAGLSEVLTKQMKSLMTGAQTALGDADAGSTAAITKIADSIPKNFSFDGAAPAGADGAASASVGSAAASLGKVQNNLTDAMSNLSGMKQIVSTAIPTATGSGLEALTNMQQQLTGALQSAEGLQQGIIDALPQLPALPFSLPSAASIASLIPKLPTLPCGINIKLDALEGLQKQLEGVMGELSSTVNGVFDKIDSLKAQMEASLNECMNKFKDALGEIKIPTLEFPAELLKALSLMQLDATAFTAALAKLKIDFPSIDVDSILKKMCSGLDFNFCKLVPNVKIIDGKEVTKAEPSTTAVAPPEPVPEQAAPTPAAKAPVLTQRLGTITEGDKAELDGIVVSAQLGGSTSLIPVDKWATAIRERIMTDRNKYFRLNPDNDTWVPIDPAANKLSQVDEELGLLATLAGAAKNQLLFNREKKDAEDAEKKAQNEKEAAAQPAESVAARETLEKRNADVRQKRLDEAAADKAKVVEDRAKAKAEDVDVRRKRMELDQAAIDARK